MIWLHTQTKGCYKGETFCELDAAEKCYALHRNIREFRVRIEKKINPNNLIQFNFTLFFIFRLTFFFYLLSISLSIHFVLYQFLRYVYMCSFAKNWICHNCSCMSSVAKTQSNGIYIYILKSFGNWIETRMYWIDLSIWVWHFAFAVYIHMAAATKSTKRDYEERTKKKTTLNNRKPSK